MIEDSDQHRRVLIFTPSGADGNVLERLLTKAGIASEVVAEARMLGSALEAGTGLALLAEEALGEAEQALVIDVLAAQPGWSDLPVILLTIPQHDASPLVERIWREGRSRVTLLERPLRSGTLVAAVEAGLQARARQIQVRDELERRLRIEAELKESEARFWRMADDLPLMVWVQDAEGRLEYANLTFCEYFGLIPESMSSRLWERLLHPDDGESVEAYRRAILEQRSFRIEMRARRADGTWRWLESWGRCRFGADGSYLGHISSSADINDRKRVEESLNEKTQALEEVDRRKDHFLATLGHELRNPLAALDLAFRLLEEGRGDEARLRPSMHAQVKQLTHLVNDLLEVSRITLGKLALRKSRVDLADLARAVARSIENVVEKHQTLVLSLPKALFVEGDATRLEQVLVNLLANASDYTPEHGRIEVSGASEGDEVWLAVRDTGRGLGPQHLEVIFEPFVQEDPLGSGLGIGLALVKGLVELHGGTVRAESEGSGQGAIFTLRMPVGEIRETPARARRTKRRLSRAVRVLVVDDNREFADSLGLLLERMGAETVCSYSGTAGLERARIWQPEVVLVDIGLPDMTGYAVAEELRALEGGGEMLLLAVTGFGHKESLERTRQVGFHSRLLKPVEPDDLHQLLVEYIARRDARGDARPD